MTTLPDGATNQLQWLVELFPYDPVGAVLRAQYLSNYTYITASTDSPASTAYVGSLADPVAYSNHLFTSGKISGRSDAAQGTIKVANLADKGTDAQAQVGDAYGRYDFWKGYRWQGRRVRVLMGVKDAAYSTFISIVDGYITTLTWNRDDIVINFASSLQALNKPLQTSFYDGSGGYNGTADLKGKPRPAALGIIRQVPGVLIDPANLIYELNHGAVTAIPSAWDGGASVAKDAFDYADYAALVAATIGAGKYTTYLALGLARFNTKPTGIATFDVQGQGLKDAPNIAKTVITTYGGLTSGQYSATAFTAATALQGADCGAWYGAEPVNILDVLDFVLGGIGFWYTVGLTGVFTLGRLDLVTITGPTDVNCALALTVGTTVANGLTIQTTLEPPTQIQLEYQRFYQVQTSGVATGITAAQQSSIAQEWRTVTANTAGTVATEYPQAVPLVVPTPFDASADAQTEATRLATLLGKALDIYNWGSFTNPFGVVLGSQVWGSHPRYSLSAGLAFIAIGADVDAASEQATLQLMGVAA